MRRPSSPGRSTRRGRSTRGRRIGDVFIPSKTTKFGQRFGFVRFRGVLDVDELLYSLQDIWLDTYKLR
ncbi:hypothetical protein A2U01_0053077, partial [Trifolium medium]|nr:hypothetical protein [Trifolium medium]